MCIPGTPPTDYGQVQSEEHPQCGPVETDQDAWSASFRRPISKTGQGFYSIAHTIANSIIHHWPSHIHKSFKAAFVNVDLTWQREGSSSAYHPLHSRTCSSASVWELPHELEEQCMYHLLYKLIYRQTVIYIGTHILDFWWFTHMHTIVKSLSLSEPSEC